jgi:small subunit ribosomal protein S6
MPASVYECMFLLDTNKVSGDVPGASQQLHALLEKNNAEVLASRPWDERRLAYPIKKGGVSHKKGLYYLTYFRAEGKDLRNLEHDFALNEMILRTLILRIEPKLVDIMLQLARDEHAVALQTATDVGADEEGGGDDGPRRGRRGGHDRGHGGHGGHERTPEPPAEN